MYWLWIIWHCRMLVTFIFHPASLTVAKVTNPTQRHDTGVCVTGSGIVSDGFRIRCSGTLSTSQENLELDFVFSPLWLCVGCVFVGCFFLERPPSKVVDGMLMPNMPSTRLPTASTVQLPSGVFQFHNIAMGVRSGWLSKVMKKKCPTKREDRELCRTEIMEKRSLYEKNYLLFGNLQVDIFSRDTCVFFFRRVLRSEQMLFLEDLFKKYSFAFRKHHKDILIGSYWYNPP